MKTYRSTGGPFAERPYFSDHDIDQICEDALREADTLPTVPEPIRIERFIEKRFRITPIYEDLPRGVLGYTTFAGKGIEAMYVARALAEEGTTVAQQRISSTFAHEAGHCLMHAHLFAMQEPNLRLFGGDPDVSPTKVLCRGSQSSKQPTYDGRWWELQANKAIGALLIPRPLISMLLEPFLIQQGLLGSVVLDPAKREIAVSTLARTFSVNPIVARIRLDGVYPENKGQLLL